jgi:hypothetical protein
MLCSGSSARALRAKASGSACGAGVTVRRSTRSTVRPTPSVEVGRRRGGLLQQPQRGSSLGSGVRAIDQPVGQLPAGHCAAVRPWVRRRAAAARAQPPRPSHARANPLSARPARPRPRQAAGAAPAAAAAAPAAPRRRVAAAAVAAEPAPAAPANPWRQPAGKGLGWYTGEDGYLYCDNMRVDDIRAQARRSSRPLCLSARARAPARPRGGAGRRRSVGAAARAGGGTPGRGGRLAAHADAKSARAGHSTHSHARARTHTQTNKQTNKQPPRSRRARSTCTAASAYPPTTGPTRPRWRGWTRSSGTPSRCGGSGACVFVSV